MARVVCVHPCPPPIGLPRLQVPMMGTYVQAQGSLTVKSGCDGCELVTNFLLQINPLLSSLGLPLCLIGCMGALIAFADAMEEALGPPPDPTVIAEAIKNVAEQCKCVLALALPPPVGAICDFLKMVRDIINIIASVVGCLVGLVTHLASFSLKASILLLSPSSAARSTGLCLRGQGQGMLDTLLAKLLALVTLMEVIKPVLTMLEKVVPQPFKLTITSFKEGFDVFIGGAVVNDPPTVFPADFLETLNTFNGVVQTTATAFTTIVSICPP